MLKKPRLLTRPTPARLDAPFRWQTAASDGTRRYIPHFVWAVPPLEWILANGKAPTAISTSESFIWYFEGLSDTRTLLADFFNILRDSTQT